MVYLKILLPAYLLMITGWVVWGPPGDVEDDMLVLVNLIWPSCSIALLSIALFYSVYNSSVDEEVVKAPIVEKEPLPSLPIIKVPKVETIPKQPVMDKDFIDDLKHV